jgi:hypothetical protein
VEARPELRSRKIESTNQSDPITPETTPANFEFHADRLRFHIPMPLRIKKHPKSNDTQSALPTAVDEQEPPDG